MKKLLLLFSLFLFANNVYALELVPYSSTITISDDSCTSNLLNNTFISNSYPSGNNPYGESALLNYNGYYTSYYSSVKPSTTYHIIGDFVPTSNFYIYEIRSNSTKQRVLISSSGSVNTTFTTDTTGTFVSFVIRSTLPSDTSNINFYLCEGTCTSFEQYKTTCTDPVPVSTAGSVYSSFLDLYLDRYSFLANNFTTNPYLLAMVGIIISFIVLELLLHIIHLKGGYKK